MKRLFIAVALAAFSSAASAQAVTVKLSEWKMAVSRDTVKAGSVTFRVTNEGSMNHELFVRGNGVQKGTREISKNESATLTLTLKEGTYDIYCPLADGTHRMAGMATKLVVLPAAATPAPKKKP